MTDKTLNDYYPPETVYHIMDNLMLLLEKREKLQIRVEQLEIDGCIWGNIVEEYRKVSGKEYGPYYRLTGYTDDHGHKPKPRYITADHVENTQQQINNHYERQKYLTAIKQIDRDLNQARRHIENLDRFLTGCTRDYEQLVIPAPTSPAAGNTKKE